MAWWLTTALTNATVVAVLAIPAWGLSQWIRRPALTHAVWVMLMIKLVTPPVVEIPLPWTLEVRSPEVIAWLAPDSSSAAMGTDDTGKRGEVSRGNVEEGVADTIAIDRHGASSAVIGLSNAEGSAAWIRLSSGEVIRLLLATWMLGSIVQLLGVMSRVFRFWLRMRLESRGYSVLQAEVNRLSEELQLARAPQVVLTDQRVSPMLWGVGPWVWVVFPRELWERLSRNERDSLLMHELGHFVRFDAWVRLLQLVVGVLFWWHPVVWYASRRIEESAEECCDALVAGRHTSPRVYAEAIVSTLAFLADRPSPLPPLASGVSRVPELKRRLGQILDRSVSPRLTATGRRLASAACLMTMLAHPFVPLVPVETVAASIGQSAHPTGAAPVSMQRVEPAFRVPQPPAGGVAETSAFSTSQSRGAGGRTEREQPERFADSPDGLWRLAVGDGDAIHLMSRDGAIRRHLGNRRINVAAWLPTDNQFVIGTANGIVELWDALDGRLLSKFGSPGAEVHSIAVDPRGRLIATGGADGAVTLRRIDTGHIVGIWRTLGDAVIKCVRFSNDGKELGIASDNWRLAESGRVLLLDVDTIEVTASIPVSGIVAAIAFDRFNQLSVADVTGRVAEWDLEFQVLVPTGRVPPGRLAVAAFAPQDSL